MSDPTTSDAPRRELRAGPIIGGIVLGVLVCWVWITVVLVGGFAASYSSGSDAVALAALLLAALPVVVGVVLLVRPRTRLAGAGFLMGLAIGLIAGPGVCVAMLGMG